MTHGATPRRNVYAVILAGGSGTRFWPASRRLRPKQLLPLGPSAPASLIASTVRRLEALVPPKRVLIATGTHLTPATKSELSWLPDSSFLAEPAAKNTAPCIGWAAHVILRRDPEALVMVLPSDQHIENVPEFLRVAELALKAAELGVIATVGIVPSRPETGYGYIEVGDERGPGVKRVARFVEKPNLERAQEYVASGRYLWNAGMFFFQAKTMQKAFAKHLPEMEAALGRIDRAALEGAEAEERETTSFFANCQSISIDYGVMEREAELAVVPGDYGWSDLGSWESAWELSPKDTDGNAAPESSVLVDAKNNLIADLGTAASASGKQKKVIALVGVNDLCVVETDDALLILPRERSQDVRAVVEQLKKRGQSDLT